MIKIYQYVICKKCGKKFKINLALKLLLDTSDYTFDECLNNCLPTPPFPLEQKKVDVYVK